MALVFSSSAFQTHARSLAIPPKVEVTNLPGPAPEDIIVVRKSEMPYLVPTDKAFVVTAFGHPIVLQNSLLLIDGTGVAHSRSGVAQMVPTRVPPHVVAPPGSQLDTNNTNSDGVIWGYLVDA